MCVSLFNVYSFLLLLQVMILSPGAYNPSEPAIPAHLNWVMIAVRCSDVCLVTLAVRLTAQRAPDRTAVRTYAKFVVLSSCAFILGRALSFQAPLRLLNGAGLCVLDVAVVSSDKRRQGKGRVRGPGHCYDVCACIFRS